MSMVAEGVATTKAVVALSQRLQVEMPIAHALARILFEGDSPLLVMEELLSRAPKKEFS